MTDYLKREDVLKVHTSIEICDDCEHYALAEGNALLALPPDPVAAAAILLAEAYGVWIEGPSCLTAFHRTGMGPCKECEGRAKMNAALAEYRAAREAAK